jgi:glyoxylase I family protein
MERVTGIGGLFFGAADPDALGAWYAEHLGVDPVPTDYDQQPWRQEAGPTVFAAMPADTGMLRGRSWAVNFRVRDLDAMVAQLRASGITVDVDGETYPNGTFAELADPEGNVVQLWQPAGIEAE